MQHLTTKWGPLLPRFPLLLIRIHTCTPDRDDSLQKIKPKRCAERKGDDGEEQSGELFQEA